MINNRHLDIFTAVYEEGSMTGAGRRIHMTQPAVSQAIREIEDEYNTELFERYGSKLHVTQAGKILYDYSRRIKNLYEDLEEEIRLHEGVRQIRVGGNISAGTAQMVTLIERFHEIYPDIEVKVMVYQAPVLLNAIIRNELDVAFLEMQNVNQFNREYVIEPYYKDRIVLVGSPDHRFAGKQVSIKDLDGESFLFRERGAGVRDMFDNILSINNVSVKTSWECTSTEAIVNAISKKMGIAVLPYLLIRNYLKDGIIKEIFLKDVSLSRDLNIVYHKDKVLTKPLETIINLMRKIGEEESF